MTPAEQEAERAILERHIRVASNRALVIGGLCSALLGVVGACGILAFILVTGRMDFIGPCIASVVGGLSSLGLWAAARSRLLHGSMRYFVMIPFVSLPTVIFLAMAPFYDAGIATFLTGPFSYLYLFLVVVTGFLFSPRLTLTCSMIAAIEYLVLQLWARPVYLRIQAPDPLLYLDLTEPFIYANKALMLVATGSATAGIAWVGRRLLEQVLREEREKEMIGRLFGEYVSPEVKHRIVEQKGQVVGERRDVAILFCDLRGFSTFSEGRDPADVMERLNEYFESMVGAIERNGGVVDKFVGDAVMAVFGGLVELENSSAAAVRAAHSMRIALADLNASKIEPGRTPFDNGIGVHFGAVIQGPLGAATRKEFTVIGDAVNIASRLESSTKELGHHVIVSGDVYDQLGATARLPFTSCGEITVKGKQEAIRVFGAKE